MDKTITPMLIGKEEENPFDSDDFLYELKMDGIRCLAFIENHEADLRNKRNQALLPKFPELKSIYQYVKHDCILDGELYCFENGSIDFAHIQKRSLISNHFKIQLESNKFPAVFTAFDILFYDNKDLTNLTLIERKKYLKECIQETPHFNISRYIFHDGIALYERTKQLELEGIVAKKTDSKYKVNTRTKEWIKIKHLKDDDFAVPGYIQKKQGISLILAQYKHNRPVYIGQVMSSIHHLPAVSKSDAALFDIDHVIWIKPYPVARVKFMERTVNGSLRQPILVDFIHDKNPKDCHLYMG